MSIRDIEPNGQLVEIGWIDSYSAEGWHPQGFWQTWAASSGNFHTSAGYVVDVIDDAITICRDRQHGNTQNNFGGPIQIPFAVVCFVREIPPASL